MTNYISTRINIGIYDIHVVKAGKVVYAGRIKRSDYDGAWQTFLGKQQEYDRDFNTKRDAIAWLRAD